MKHQTLFRVQELGYDATFVLKHLREELNPFYLPK
jgi:hypothetical protein